MKPLALLLSLACLAATAFAQEPANLLHNANFETWTNGKPQGWSVAHGQTVTPVTDAAADGVQTALGVEVTQSGGESLGEIRQTVKGVSGGRFRFEGMLRSSKPGLVIFMIKLREGKVEKKRISSKEKSSGEWTMTSLEFDAEDATEIQVLCRYRRTQEFVGATGAFTKLKLVNVH